MSTQTITRSKAVDAPLPISFPLLLLIYAVVPLCALITISDFFFFKGALRHALPDDPEELRFFTVLFVYPHIVASANSFFDSEYLSFYKSKLIRAVGVACLLGIALPLACGEMVGGLIFATYTVYHVMAQQVGITTMMTGKPDSTMKVWKWLAIFLTWVIYIPVYSDLDLPLTFFNAPLLGIERGHWIYGMFVAFLGAFVLYSMRLSKRASTNIAKSYIWSNVALVAFAATFYVMGYSFFAVFAPRIVHDLSGFAFYVVHDHNRNRGEVKNYLYQLLRFTRVPVFILTPVFGILVANALLQVNMIPAVETFLIVLSYFHYYTEGFMWKRDAIHRESVPTRKLQVAHEAVQNSSLAA